MKAENYTARDAWMLGGSGTTGGADGKETRFCTALSKAIFTDAPSNRKCAELYARACRWVEMNPATWSDWCAEVARHVEAGRSWSIQALAERDRRSGHVDAAGEDFMINNSQLPALARMICEAVPGAVQFTELRVSIFERAALERQR